MRTSHYFKATVIHWLSPDLLYYKIHNNNKKPQSFMWFVSSCPLSPPPLIAWEGRTCLFLREIGPVACIGAALADVETRFIVSKCFWFPGLWCEVFSLENRLHGKGWLVSSKLPDWNLFPPHLPDSLASLCISYKFTPIQIYFHTIQLYVSV